MLLAGPIATLRSKLTEKVKYRPTAAIEPLLPAGTDALDDLPEVGPGIWYVWLRRPGASGAYHRRAPRAPVTKVPEQNHYPTPLEPQSQLCSVSKSLARTCCGCLALFVHPVRLCPPPLWLPRTVHPKRPCLSPHRLRQPPLPPLIAPPPHSPFPALAPSPADTARRCQWRAAAQRRHTRQHEQQ